MQAFLSSSQNTELDFEEGAVLVQEYVGNPFTAIEGRKFSIGIYVGFSSANPLRAYVLESTMFLRFAKKKYYPENLGDPTTYITDRKLYGARFASQVVFFASIIIIVIIVAITILAAPGYFYLGGDVGALTLFVAHVGGADFRRIWGEGVTPSKNSSV